jgi:peptide/nickel transport system permease protein
MRVRGARCGGFPANGYVPLDARHRPPGRSTSILPIVALGLGPGRRADPLRPLGSFLDVLGEDYYRTARSIGWTRGAALWRHGIRNAALSLVTVHRTCNCRHLIVGAIVDRASVRAAGAGLAASGRRSTPVRPRIVVRGIVMILVAVVLVVNAA